MTNEEYRKTQTAILNLSKEICKLDIVDFLAQMNLAETAGPILDPTLYRRAQHNLEAMRELAKCFLPVPGAMDKLLYAALKTSAQESLYERD